MNVLDLLTSEAHKMFLKTDAKLADMDYQLEGMLSLKQRNQFRKLLTEIGMLIHLQYDTDTYWYLKKDLIRKMLVYFG